MSNEAITTTVRPKALSLWPFFLLGLILIVLFWGANVWLTGDVGGNAEPEEAQRAEVRIKNLADLQAENAKKLDSYAWVDRAKGSVQIPIAEAMKLTVSRINETQPRAAYPVVVPAAPAPQP